jgi:hypothetical protein
MGEAAVTSSGASPCTSSVTDVPGSPTMSLTMSFTSHPLTSAPSTLRDNETLVRQEIAHE